MPLQRQNSLRLVADAQARDGLDELLGAGEARPGELHEPFGSSSPRAFETAVRDAGVPLPLAVAVVAERELVLDELRNLGAVAVEEYLDHRAANTVITNTTGAAVSDYVRELVSLLHGQRTHLAPRAPVVVPVRLANRLRATDYTPALEPKALMAGLRWELAAVANGQTITEWAQLEVLRRRS